MSAPIIATKLAIPALRPNMMQRPDLIRQLNKGLDMKRQVTLISAPAGYGKTTCICEWVHGLGRRQVAWLALDGLDDDPVRFFTCFIAALQRVQGDLGQEILSVLGSGQLPPGEIINAVLINDLQARRDKFLLVLDDFHVIQDSSILQTLEYLIRNIPEQLHLVLITREDPPLPLARLRANNLLTEIRARDLRLTHAEVDCFLREAMGLTLSQGDVAALDDKVEGWVAGLQLAAIVMNASIVSDREEPARIIARLRGSHHYIMSYLTEQVLNHQPEAVRQFLLETAILERLNGDLCDAVSERSGSADFLEQMNRANLFLIPLEDGWYRYHPLFADLLIDRHQVSLKEKTAELHRRASRWFAQADMVEEAIRHALAAKEYAAVVRLMESHAMKWIMQGYAKTVNGWMQALPEEWRARSSQTNLAFAWALLLRGAYTEAALYLDRLQATLSAQSPVRKNSLIQAEWLVLQSLVLFMKGQLAECQDTADAALKQTRVQDHRVRSLVYYVQASVSKIRGDYAQTTETFQKSIRESRAAASPVPEILSTASLAGMALEQGQLHLAFEVASQQAQRMERSGVRYPIGAMIYASLAEVCYQWYQLVEAREFLQKALHLSILGGANTVLILCRVLLSRTALIRGEYESAGREIQAALDLMPMEAPEYVRQEVVSQRVRVSLAQNRPAAAIVALQEIGISDLDLEAAFDLQVTSADQYGSAQQISSSAGLLCNSLLRLLLYQAQAAQDQPTIAVGIDFADRILDRAIKNQQQIVVLETLLLRAQMQALIGNETASTADMIRALTLAEPEEFISVFIEAGQHTVKALADLARKKPVGSVQAGYVKRILDAYSSLCSSAFESPAPNSSDLGSVPELIEPLSEREREILRWISEGLKYQEIGERLYISKNTVRYHVRSIYGKLQVNNRVQAITKARQLNIL